MRLPALLSALVATAVIACGQSAAQPLVVGVAGPMSGQFELFGKQMADGAKMAIEDVNRRGGVKTRRLQIRLADTGCKADMSEAVAEEMVAQSVAVVIGHFCSRPSMAAAKIYHRARLVQIAPASPDPKFTSERPDPGGGTYRVGPGADEHLATLNEFLLSNWRDTPISLLSDGSDYGKLLVESVAGALSGAGIEPVANETFRAGQKSFRALVSKLNAVRTGAVVVGAYHTDISAIYAELARQNRTIALIAGDTGFVPELTRLAGGSPKHLYVVAQRTPEALLADPEFAVRAMAAGYVPGRYFLTAYAAVRIWAAARAAAASDDYAAIVGELNSKVFETPLGDVSFDDSGNWSRSGYRVYQLRAGQFEPATP